MPEPSDAVLTIPNLLTFFRIALTPLFLWLALGPDRIGAASIVMVVALATDLLDGKIARAYGQVTKLGILLDPLSDRLGLAAGAWVLINHHLAPVWAIALVAARDAFLVLVGAPLLKARGIPIPPVSRLGKNASFAISMCFGLFLLSGIHDVAHPTVWIHNAAWVFFALGVPAYYLTAVGYGRAAMASSRGKGNAAPR